MSSVPRFSANSTRRRQASSGGSFATISPISASRHALVEPVGTLDQPAAATDAGGEVIDLDDGLLADAAGQHAAHLAVGGVLRREQAEFDLEGGIGMVGGQLRNPPVLHQVRATIADVPDRQLVVPQQRDGQGGGHAAGGAALHAPVVDGQVRGGEQLPEELAGGGAGLGLLELFQRGLDGQPAGDVALPLASHPIGQHDDRPARPPLLGVVGLPEADAILILGPDRPLGGQLGVNQIHEKLRARSDAGRALPAGSPIVAGPPRSRKATGGKHRKSKHSS